ncbi:MAG TPA: NAD-dependent epimerase/dehydratase family protein [Bryobacterales bacterium]|nr:NAD-dependent epimerase/dehydratase family protein [Bryobacterales bacterium]
MSRNVLITGGAGFIGGHLATELLRHGYAVRALDCLTSQVHGQHRQRPGYLNRDVELLTGDLRDETFVDQSVRGVDAVYHFAAAVGVGQSMYRIAEYTSMNNLATAVLLQALSRRRVRRLIVASSMSVYGEGLYRASDGSFRERVQRTPKQLTLGDWEIRDENGFPLTPVPTPETKPPCLASVYALSKFDQEKMCQIVGAAYGIEVVALRFFNVYGPHQALSNPYTGALVNFAARLMNGKPPLLFEDGRQQRDFVSVYDAVRACRLALEKPEAAGGVFNVGSGKARSVREVACLLGRVLGKGGLEPEVTGQYRAGDIRHCFADITLAWRVLGYEPGLELEPGVAGLAQWLEGQIARDRVAEARSELASRGLVI